MTIHSGHPFLEPPHERRVARRLRARLVAPVTVWAARGPAARRAGLTVSSVLVADGEPARLLGLLDDESDLWPLLRAEGRTAVSLLAPDDSAVADVFAGLAPSPGGAFRTGQWVDTDWGPVLQDRSWVGALLVGEPSRVGWSLLVELEVAHVGLVDEAGALAYLRGRYVAVAAHQ